MTIGQRIAELRRQHNLSQEALGEAMGVSRQAISKWESDAALPEIDKLIALSKRFGVTVGYLLGVEEEAAAQAERQPERTGPTEAEVLEAYLKTLPKPRRVAKKWKVLGVIAAVILVICAVNYIDALERRINGLSNTISNLSDQVVNVQYELSGISDDISTRIDEALRQEYGLLASWELTLEELNYQDGTARVRLSAVLKNKAEQAQELSFYARLDDGSYVTAQDGVWEAATNAYTATLTLPMSQSELEYYISTPGGIAHLAENGHGLCNLAGGTQLQVYCSVSPFSDGSDIEGWVDLDITLPWLLTEENSDLDSFGEPKITAWLVYNGERSMTLELEETGVINVSGTWWYQAELYAGSSQLEAPPSQGDRAWVEYEISFDNGLCASGAGDEGWSYTGTSWERGEQVYVVPD